MLQVWNSLKVIYLNICINALFRRTFPGINKQIVFSLTADIEKMIKYFHVYSNMALKVSDLT